MVWAWWRQTHSGNQYMVRRLEYADRAEAISFMDHAPIETVLMRGFVDTALRERPSQPAQYFLGYFGESGDRLSGLCWNGANIIPWGFNAIGMEALARELNRSRLIANSFVGDAQQVMALWKLTSHRFKKPRDVRSCQLSMVYQGEEAEQVAPDLSVRQARTEEFALVFPASVAMFIEEVGYDPSAHSKFYEDRVRELLQSGYTFVRIGTDVHGLPRIEFKADIGAYAGGVAQIQGVWVPPELRGSGIAASAMVSVARFVHHKLGAAVHLYVNDYNAPAVRTYEKAGFAQVGNYATILL